MAKVPNGVKYGKNIAENFNRLYRAHERYRRQTDGRTTTYSERAKNSSITTLTDIVHYIVVVTVKALFKSHFVHC